MYSIIDKAIITINHALKHIITNSMFKSFNTNVSPTKINHKKKLIDIR